MRVLLDSFPDWTTAALADACLQLELPVRCAPAGLKPSRPCSTAGPVRPVRHYGSVDVFFEAIERSRPGEILVIDNEGRCDEGCIGDLTALEARSAGVCGILCWGSIRDSEQLQSIGLPIFAYGTIPCGPTSTRPRSIDALVSARFGNIVVDDKDVVFADSDGAIFVTANEVDRVMAAGQIIWTTEREQARRADEGTSLREQFLFQEFLKHREVFPDHTFREHLRKHGLAIEV